MKKKKLQRTDERKVIIAMGRKLLATSLCALLSVTNTIHIPVWAQEGEEEPVIVEEQSVEEPIEQKEWSEGENTEGLCAHRPEHNDQCGTNPCQYRCITCLQRNIADIIAILKEESAEDDPLQAVYTRIEHAYDTYVALNEDELTQLEEDEYGFMEAVLKQEEAIISHLNALDGQIEESGQA
ncbi:hypothetical protein, partial [Dubosiella newyorkensis]